MNLHFEAIWSKIYEIFSFWKDTVHKNMNIKILTNIKLPLYLDRLLSLWKHIAGKFGVHQKSNIFVRQLVTRHISVKKNLKAREIQGDIRCALCGAGEETINHVFLSVYRLSKFEPSHVFLQTHKSFPFICSFQIWTFFFWRVFPQM